MPLRDLGYQPYDGPRLPPAHNRSVLLRYGMRRAWASWLVKFAVLTAWVPTVVKIAVLALGLALAGRTPGVPKDLSSEFPAILRGLFDWQLWCFLTLVTLGAGASAIAEDLSQRVYSFYFSKPVSPEQYLMARMGAVSLWCFFLTAIPALLVITAMVGLAPPEGRLAALTLLLPALLYSGFVSVVLGTASVGLSALSPSRALTMGTWLLVLLVPLVLAIVVQKLAGWPWLWLLSIPGQLGIIGDALFKIEPTTAVRWYHAMPVLMASLAAIVWFSLRRLRSAEVIA